MTVYSLFLLIGEVKVSLAYFRTIHLDDIENDGMSQYQYIDIVAPNSRNVNILIY